MKTVSLFFFSRIKKQLIVVVALLISFSAFSQNLLEQKLDFIVEDLSIVETLYILSEATEIEISFDPSLLDPNKIISLHEIDVSISHILDKCLKGQEVEYIADGDKIVVRSKSFAPYSTCGFVADSNTDEGLVGAVVENKITGQKVITNRYGYFSIDVNDASTTFLIKKEGYQTQESRIHQTKGFLKLLLPSITHSDTLSNDKTDTITNNYPRKIVDSEWRDHLLFLQYGIQNTSANDGAHAIQNWGGQDDQNVVYMDGVKVLQPYHALRQWSIFDRSLIKSFIQQQEYISSRYAGNLSSIIDLTMREGSTKNSSFDIGLNNFNGKFTADIPIIRNKVGVLFSYKGNYQDPWRQGWYKSNATLDNTSIQHDYKDIYAKVFFNIKKRHRVELINFHQKDRLTGILEYDSIIQYTTPIPATFEHSYKNKNRTSINQNITALSWRYVAKQKLIFKTTFSYSIAFNENNSIVNGIQQTNTPLSFLYQSRKSFKSNLSDQLEGLVVFDYYQSKYQRLKFGGQVDLRSISSYWRIRNKPLSEIPNDTLQATYTGDASNTKEIRFFVEDNLQFKKWNVNLGLSISGFETKEINFFSVEPRLNLKYELKDDASLFLSYLRNKQPIQRISVGNIALSSDFAVASNFNRPPPTSSQMTAGYVLKFNNKLKGGITVYNKQIRGESRWANHTILNANTANFNMSNWHGFTKPFDESIYGLQWHVQYEKNNTALIIGHQISKSSLLQLDSPLQQTPVEDLKNKINLTFSYTFNNKLRLGLDWQYATGSLVYDYSYQNSYSLLSFYDWHSSTTPRTRLAPYHRLDLIIDYTSMKSKTSHTFYIKVRNAYNRRNEIASYSGYTDGNDDTLYIIHGQSIYPLIGFQFSWKNDKQPTKRPFL